VLVVDDDRVARQLIGVNLRLDDFEVFTAVDGVECMDRIRVSRPTWSPSTCDASTRRLADGRETSC